MDILQDLLQADESNASMWYLFGLECAKEHDTDRAFEAFGNALRLGDEALKQRVIAQLQVLSAKMVADAGELGESVTDEGADLVLSDPVRLSHFETEDESMSAPFMQVIDGGKETKRAPEVVKRQVTFDDVGGLSDVKEAIRMKIIQPFLSPGLFERFQKKAGGGILLYGPPGCGKTFIAKATAGECKANFVGVQISDILDPYIGVSEQQLHDVFDSARVHRPSILFFDEVDALGFHRSKSSNGYMRGVIDQLLTELDGLETGTNQILVIGATNMPWDVDPAFKRPGRFDKMLFVPPPDFEARKSIFRLKLQGKPTGAIDYDILAKATELFSGADIENAVETATERVITEIMKTGVERPIQSADLRDAVADTVPSTIDWLRTVKTYVRYANQSRQYDEVQAFIARHKI